MRKQRRWVRSPHPSGLRTSHSGQGSMAPLLEGAEGMGDLITKDSSELEKGYNGKMTMALDQCYLTESVIAPCIVSYATLSTVLEVQHVL